MNELVARSLTCGVEQPQYKPQSKNIKEQHNGN